MDGDISHMYMRKCVKSAGLLVLAISSCDKSLIMMMMMMMMCLSTSLMIHYTQVLIARDSFKSGFLFVFVFVLIFCLHSDEEELRKSFSELGDSLCDSDASRSMKRVSSSGKPLSEETQPTGALLYKNGFLVRKVHADSDGKRSMSLSSYLITLIICRAFHLLDDHRRSQDETSSWMMVVSDFVHGLKTHERDEI